MEVLCSSFVYSHLSILAITSILTPNSWIILSLACGGMASLGVGISILQRSAAHAQATLRQSFLNSAITLFTYGTWILIGYTACHYFADANLYSLLDLSCLCSALLLGCSLGEWLFQQGALWTEADTHEAHLCVACLQRCFAAAWRSFFAIRMI